MDAQQLFLARSLSALDLSNKFALLLNGQLGDVRKPLQHVLKVGRQLVLLHLARSLYEKGKEKR